MSWVAVGAAAVAAAGSIYSANKSSHASKDANNDNIAEQQRQFDLIQQNLGPYMQYGTGSLGGLSQLMAGGPHAYDGFLNSPDFKARVGFANDQFNNGAAAHYRLFSGGAQNDRDELNQNLAAQGLGDYRNFLQWGANLGQNAAAGVGQAGQNMANANSNSRLGIADAQGTAYGAMAGGLANLAGTFANHYTPSSYGNTAPAYNPSSDPLAGRYTNTSGWRW